MKNFLLFLISPLFKGNTYRIRRGIGKALRRKGGFGFLPTLRKLTKEESFLLNLDLEDQTIYDIGGNIGIFSLFFARAVGHQGKVITFEPNLICYRELINNIKINSFSNVVAYKYALGKKNCKKELSFNPVNTGIGSINNKIKHKILDTKGAKNIEVEVYSLDYLIESKNLPAPDFIKIDVEGLEYDVLSGMSKIIGKIKPKLFIEIHGLTIEDKIENVKKVTSFLIKNKYSVYHVESDEMINELNASTAKLGHLYCS